MNGYWKRVSNRSYEDAKKWAKKTANLTPTTLLIAGIVCGMMGFIFGGDEFLKKTLAALLAFVAPNLLIPLSYLIHLFITPGRLEQEAKDDADHKLTENQTALDQSQARANQLKTELERTRGANPQRRFMVEALQGFIVSLTEIRGAIAARHRHTRSRFDDVTNSIHRYFREHLSQDIRYASRYPLRNNPGFEQNIREQDVESFLRDCDGRIELLQSIKAELDM